MISSEMIRPLMPLFAVQPAGTSEADCNYSIRLFLDWHHHIIRDTVQWCSQNGTALFFATLWLGIIAVLSLAFFLLLRKVIVPVIGKWYGRVAKELMAISSPTAWLLFWLGASFNIDALPFSAKTHQVLDTLFYICFIVTILGIFRRALQCTVDLMIERFKERDPENYGTNKLLLDLSTSIIRLLVLVGAVIFILQNVLHLRVTNLLASAGILGLAVAFAAKDTIANIFGAFSILGSKMFRVGDWIKTGSTEGVVEQIGVRSIRIRAFSDGRIIEIPNHVVADSQIENFNAHTHWREHFCFGLVYQTTYEQMTLAKKILEEIGNDLAEYMVPGKPVRFDFILFDQSSLNLDGYVWFKATDGLTMRRARGRFNEEVLKRFNAAGLVMAFPTTTVVLENTETK